MSAKPQTCTYVISIMAKDRVGIIAEVSSKISALNGDIADIRQSVLCGYFSMILMVSFPAEVTQSEIIARLAEINRTTNASSLEIQVKPVYEAVTLPASTFPDNTYVLTVTGPDRVGFVAAVSEFCKANQINILDLSTTRKLDQYVMILFIDLTQAITINLIRENIKQFSKETGFRVVLQHYNIFRAVNEIDLPAV